MNEIECPYCEHGFDLCHDDGEFYEENTRVETQCPACEKNFLVVSRMSWDFEGEKADCLNGSEHKWKKKYPRVYREEHEHLSRMEVCEDCEEERTLPKICKTCNGTGELSEDFINSDGNIEAGTLTKKCPDCNVTNK